MGILTDDMKRIVREQRLVYIATVCPDVTDETHLCSDTCSRKDHLAWSSFNTPLFLLTESGSESRK